MIKLYSTIFFKNFNIEENTYEKLQHPLKHSSSGVLTYLFKKVPFEKTIYGCNDGQANEQIL